MLIIPAIDLMGGKVVRLTKGDFTTSKIYSDDPIEVAKHWQEKGAKRIHIVDLDGARIGECKNLDIARNIAKELKIPVQLGGGIRNLDAVRKVFDCGVRWVILGTGALSDEKFLQEAVSSFPDRSIVSVDVKDGRIYIKGWKESLTSDIFTPPSVKRDSSERGEGVAFFKKLYGMKISSLIVTDIQKDGTLEGVDVELFAEICKQSSIPIIVAGGISSLEDIKRLSAVKKVEGVIIGKALYEGKIDLEKAIKETSDKREGI